MSSEKYTVEQRRHGTGEVSSDVPAVQVSHVEEERRRGRGREEISSDSRQGRGRGRGADIKDPSPGMSNNPPEERFDHSDQPNRFKEESVSSVPSTTISIATLSVPEEANVAGSSPTTPNILRAAMRPIGTLTDSGSSPASNANTPKPRRAICKGYGR